MKRLGLVFPVVLLLILSLSVSVSAAEIMESQEQMEFVIEQGGSVEFLFFIQNTESGDELRGFGDIEDWISFGESHMIKYECDSRTIDWPLITIDIPQDTEIGEYEGGIDSDTEAAIIIVKVVPPLDEVKSMQDLEEMNEELEAMTDSMSQELSTTKDGLQARIAEISQYQQDMSDLEAELEELREASQELEEANTQLTGQVAGGAPVQVVVGIVIGIVIVMLYLGRRGIAKALRSARMPSSGDAGDGEKYKGWKPS